MQKKKLILNKALLDNEKLIFGFKNHEDKIFDINALKKFSIRKTKSSTRIYFVFLPFLILGYFIHPYFYFTLGLAVLYFLYVKFYYRVYKLILIDKSEKKYIFTFDKKLRSVVFNVRLRVKYKLLID